MWLLWHFCYKTIAGGLVSQSQTILLSSNRDISERIKSKFIHVPSAVILFVICCALRNGQNQRHRRANNFFQKFKQFKVVWSLLSVKLMDKVLVESFRFCFALFPIAQEKYKRKKFEAKISFYTFLCFRLWIIGQWLRFIWIVIFICQFWWFICLSLCTKRTL